MADTSFDRVPTTRCCSTPEKKIVDTARRIGNNYSMPKTKTMTELLRKQLADAPSLLDIERATGVKRQSLLRFLRGQQSLRLDFADKLAHHFGIRCHIQRKD